MTHIEMLKAAGFLDKWLIPRPGVKNLLKLRRRFKVSEQAPFVGDDMKGLGGQYLSRSRTAIIPKRSLGEDARQIGRHEVMHGYQYNSRRKDMNPLTLFGRRKSPRGSLMEGIRDVALETDARIAERKSILGGLNAMRQDAPGYIKTMEGVAKLPYQFLSLFSHL